MTRTVAQRIRHGLGANLYNQLVTVAVQLVGVPILLHAWGAKLYGEWLILFAIPAYLSVADLGFSQSAGNDMTASVARGDQRAAVRTFQSLVVLVYGVSLVSLAVVIGVCLIIPLDRWVSLEAMNSGEARMVLLLLLAETAARFPDGANQSGFRASGDYPLQQGLAATSRLLQYTGVWVVALAGGGPLHAALAFCAIRIAATGAGACLLLRRHRWLRFSLHGASVQELRRLLRPAFANVAIPLAQALNIQGMVLAIGTVLGPVAVVVFSTMRTLTRLSFQLVRSVSLAAEPELAAAYGATDVRLMASLFVHVLRAGLWLALGGAAGLLLFGETIFRVWTHAMVRFDSELFLWLLLSAVAGVLWYGGLITVRAANKHLVPALTFVTSSIAAIGVATCLLGLTGKLAHAALALLLMDVVLAVVTMRTAGRVIGVPPSVVLLRALNPFPLVRIAWARPQVSA